MNAEEKNRLLCHIITGDYNVFRQTDVKGALYCYNIKHPFLNAGFHFYTSGKHLYRSLDYYDYGSKIVFGQKDTDALLSWLEEKAK